MIPILHRVYIKIYYEILNNLTKYGLRITNQKLRSMTGAVSICRRILSLKVIKCFKVFKEQVDVIITIVCQMRFWILKIDFIVAVFNEYWAKFFFIRDQSDLR